MASISISGWNSSGGRVYTLSVSEGSYNSSTKKTTVNWSLSSSGGGGSWYDAYLYASVNGGQVYNSGKVSWASGAFPATTGSTSGSIQVDQSSGAAVSVPFYIEGYCFSYDVRSNSGSITLPARTVTITYDNNDGSGGPSSQTVTAGGSLTLSTSRPTRFGYNFVCWMGGSKEYYPGETYTFTENTTLLAYYEYVWLNTTTAASKTATINYGGEMYYFAVKTTSADDYTFYSVSSGDTRMYLYNSSGTELTSDDDSGDGNNFKKMYALSANTTYYLGVRWYGSSTTGSFTVHMRRTYHVNYSLNGGSGTAPDAFYKMYGISTTVTSTVPTKANTTASGYTITFNPNDGVCTTKTLTATDTLSWSFRCWSTASGSANEYDPGESFSLNSDATLSAQWTSSIATRGSITLPTPTRDGYTFMGWAESATATFGSKGTYTPNGTKTLYAIWSLIPRIPLLKTRYNNGFVTNALIKVKVNGKWVIVKAIKLKTNGDF